MRKGPECLSKAGEGLWVKGGLMVFLFLGPFQKSWTASLETRGRSWVPHFWAAHPLGWQAQALSGP